MTRYLDRLEKAGLIVRSRSPEDGRRIRLALTPKGVRVLRSVRRRRTAWLAERLDGLDPADQRAVAAALAPLEQMLEEEDR
jgi:DNA-binding MarR family transcriptional regulator